MFKLLGQDTLKVAQTMTFFNQAGNVVSKNHQDNYKSKPTDPFIIVVPYMSLTAGRNFKVLASSFQVSILLKPWSMR